MDSRATDTTEDCREANIEPGVAQSPGPAPLRTTVCILESNTLLPFCSSLIASQFFASKDCSSELLVSEAQRVQCNVERVVVNATDCARNPFGPSDVPYGYLLTSYDCPTISTTCTTSCRLSGRVLFMELDFTVSVYFFHGIYYASRVAPAPPRGRMLSRSSCATLLTSYIDCPALPIVHSLLHLSPFSFAIPVDGALTILMIYLGM